MRGDVLINLNIYEKCDVCGSVTRVRIQAGWLDSHPIRYKCGRCGISINGICNLDQKKPNISVDFENATLINNEQPEFYLESSGELITEKMRKSEDQDKFLAVPPFFRAKDCMGEDISIFMNGFLEFQNDVKINWPKYRRIFELYQNGNEEYLIKELNKVLSPRLFPCDNELEIIRAVHFLIFKNFKLLTMREFSNGTLGKISDLTFKLDIEQLHLILTYFKKNNDMLKRFRKKIFDILSEFVDIFKFLIPAYGLTYYKAQVDYNNYGMTTCSFDDLKQYYLDLYEVLGEILLVPVGLDNILIRKDFNKFNIDNLKAQINLEKFKSFDDLKKAKVKGAKYKFVNLNEPFCGMTDIVVNTKLRNSIGHNDYKFDPITQEIVYIPDSSKPDKKEKIYLLEFALTCIELTKSILIIEEMIYRIEKFEYIKNGCKPKIKPGDFLKKVGRNEPCLCGSGKKYKKCHGEN